MRAFKLAALMCVLGAANVQAQDLTGCIADVAAFRADSVKFAAYSRMDSRKVSELDMTARVHEGCAVARTNKREGNFLDLLDAVMGRVKPDTVFLPGRVDTVVLPGRVDTVRVVDTVFVPRDTAVTPPVDTVTPPPVTPPPAGGTLAAYTNRPANFTNVLTDEPFSDSLAAGHEVRFGTGGWRATWNAPGLLRRTSDATAPVSPNWVYEAFYSLAGTDGGSGVGDMYRPLPSVPQVFIGLTVKWDSNFEWNSISNKMIMLLSGSSNRLIQARYNSRYLVPYSGSQQIQQFTGTIPLGVWNRIEILADAANSHVKVWLNGALVQDAAFNWGGSTFTQVNLDTTWGGGGTKTRDSWRWIDHLVVVVP